MSSSLPDTDDWVNDLPVFEGILSKQTSSLLRPFSRFSITSLFKSSTPTTSLPSLTLLDPLLRVASISASDPVPPQSEIYKSLEGLKEFATQLKEALDNQKMSLAPEDSAGIIEKLAKAYLAGVHIISRSLWDDPSSSTSRSIEEQAHRTALRGCIQGVFHLLPVSTQLDISTEGLDKNILGSIFPPSETTFHQLSPLLAYPRQLITSLQSQPARPIAHSKVKSPIQSPTQSTFPHIVRDEEVLYVISILDTFLGGIAKIEPLSGPVLAKTKKQKEEDIRRPLRIEMEVSVLKCDLLISMATKRISDLKHRAMLKLQGDEQDDVQSQNADVNGISSASGEEGNDEDIKPKIDRTDDGDSGSPLISSPAEKEEYQETVKWEDLSEESLVECLDLAKRLIEEGRGEVLSNHVEAVEWLGEEGIDRPEEDQTTRKSRSPTTHDDNGDSGSEFDSEDDFDTESETESSLESGGSGHPCPLGTIFRLHDRYEEQRLAVWLHLPAAKRGKMGWYMRGEDGKVGASWDAFGLAAMMEYDSQTLLGYGLGPDKHDKWIELASMKNAKKIKKRGRKTV